MIIWPVPSARRYQESGVLPHRIDDNIILLPSAAGARKPAGAVILGPGRVGGVEQLDDVQGAVALAGDPVVDGPVVVAGQKPLGFLRPDCHSRSRNCLAHHLERSVG